jgi:hypothetical protein
VAQKLTELTSADLDYLQARIATEGLPAPARPGRRSGPGTGAGERAACWVHLTSTSALLELIEKVKRERATLPSLMRVVVEPDAVDHKRVKPAYDLST